MLEMQDLDVARSNPIWKYFSGHSYDSRLLLDYGFMNEEEYATFIKSLAFEYKIQKQPKHLKLFFDTIILCQHDGTILNPDTNEPLIHNCEGVFNLLKWFYGPLKLRQIEIGIIPQPRPYILDDARFESYHGAIFDNFAKQKPGVADFVNCLDFVYDTVFDLARQANIQKKFQNKKEKNISLMEMLMKESFEILPNLANTLLLDLQVDMMKILIEQDENTRKPLSAFYFMTNMAFSLKEKSLTEGALLDKSSKILNLTDRAIVYAPFVSLNKKVAFFDDVLKIKERLENQIKKVANQSAYDILIKRGAYGKEKI